MANINEEVNVTLVITKVEDIFEHHDLTVSDQVAILETIKTKLLAPIVAFELGLDL